MTGSVIVLERTIDASMDDVWGVLIDEAHQAQMFDGVADVEVVASTPPEHMVITGTMHHDPVRISFALTPQRAASDRTRLAMTMRADIKHRSLLGQAMWHTLGMWEHGHERRTLMHDLDEIAKAAESGASPAA
jgi:hypothetical protein